MDSILTPLGALAILAPAVVLIYLQPNLGTALSWWPSAADAARERAACAPALLFGGRRWARAAGLALPAAGLHEGSYPDVRESSA